MELTQDHIKQVLDYDQITGVFKWVMRASSRSRIKIGEAAGFYNTNGYRQIKLCGKLYLASRLAFLYMTGKWPSELVDHIDRNPKNNTWANLREATRSENNRNKGTHAGKTSQFRGVSKRKDKWIVVIRVNGKPKYLGQFECEHEAGKVAAPYFADIAP